ncbi:MAG: orotate phosphoribosyltransferase [Aquificaceae bacterium]|nr:orotate phosphoribosyltransferase [Aquificaceae bacterium]
MDKERLKNLIKERSLKVAEEPIFKLSSGRLSRYYIDLKQITFDPESLYTLCRVMSASRYALRAAGVGALPLGADPKAYSVAMISYLAGSPQKPFVVRKEPKAHGTGRQIEGLLKAGDRVVVFEDVITTGASALKAVQACQKEGYEVLCVYAVVDREEGGRENLEREGLKVFSLFKVSDLL